MKKSGVDVLWTGGWDSTYRVIYASLVEKREVRPHYVVDVERRSSLHELQAISNVRRAIERIDESAVGRIAELAITPVTEIAAMPDITQAYQDLVKRAPLGSQYDWLARYARQKGVDSLELSVHVDDKAHYFLQGKVKKDAEHIWALSGSETGGVATLFSGFSFPLLELSKVEMRAMARRCGFIDALEKSWFCSKPMNGQPCGMCNPCIYSIEEGMSYRFSSSAMMRYKTRNLRKLITSPLKATGKAYRIICG